MRQPPGPTPRRGERYDNSARIDRGIIEVASIRTGSATASHRSPCLSKESADDRVERPGLRDRQRVTGMRDNHGCSVGDGVDHGLNVG